MTGFEVDPDIRRAETLPPAAFTSRDFLQRELDTIFTRSHLLVPETEDERPLAEQLGARGSRLPFTLLGRPLFLQRGWDDEEVRCFPNACTHAWFPLVPGPSRGPTLVCGQHGRKFDCAGRFVAQQGFTDAPDFPRDCDHLRPLPVSRWGQLLFVALGAPSAALDETLAPVHATVSKLPLAAARRSRAVAEAREVPGNWKQHAWNFMDRFHIGFIHRAPGGLQGAVEMASYTTELHGRAALQWVYARRPDDGFDPELMPERLRDAQGARRVFALWWFVFPNLALNYYPWGLSVNVFEPIPERPDVTLFRWYHLVMDEARYARREESWLSSQVNAEDVDAMAQVRRSLRVPDLPRGRFAPGEEAGAHWFHRLVSESVRSSGP